jgi:hypothetical protein
MTRHGVVLPIPDDPRIAEWIDKWPAIEQLWWNAYPRSYWLGGMEGLLRQSYPQSNSRNLNVTARSLAPFPLAEHDW